jgi:hypothetical protein
MKIAYFIDKIDISQLGIERLLRLKFSLKFVFLLLALV